MLKSRYEWKILEWDIKPQQTHIIKWKRRYQTGWFSIWFHSKIMMKSITEDLIVYTIRSENDFSPKSKWKFCFNLGVNNNKQLSKLSESRHLNTEVLFTSNTYCDKG